MIKSKKGKACLILILVYVIVGCVIYYREYQGAENIGENAEIEIADSAGNEVPEGKSDPVTEDYVRDFADIRNTLVYADASQTGMYVDSENIQLADVDRESILTLYRLPPLERMDAQDAGTLMAELQVLDRIDALGIDPHVFYTPEYNWKEIYSNSLLKVKESLDFQNRVYFSGASASELNQFMIENVNCVIEIQASELVLDETLRVPSNVIIQGNGVVIAGDSNVDYAIMLERVKNAGVYDVKLSGGFQQGIYVIESSNVLLWKNEITNAVCKAVCVMGDCSSVNLVNNSIYNNGNGAVFFDGNISDCIIEGNSVYENQGTRNLNAGIVLCAVELENIYTPYNEFKDIHLYDIVDAPHNNVIIHNSVQSNYSSGIYSDSGYMNYIVDNLIEDNEKEGMCLDYGTFGTYVKGNVVRRNGDRNRQTDEDLAADFILGAGRLPDGSSTAKLPGISLDNTAYNILLENTVSGNSGSGIKAVRSAYRNVIFSNIITDNNRGKSDFFHGFGVELGNATVPDEPVEGLDFTADYENIVARNIITGAHYSAVFMADGSYCNDIIDNMMMECEYYSVENHSSYFNGSIGNTSNVETLDYELK